MSTKGLAIGRGARDVKVRLTGRDESSDAENFGSAFLSHKDVLSGRGGRLDVMVRALLIRPDGRQYRAVLDAVLLHSGVDGLEEPCVAIQVQAVNLLDLSSREYFRRITRRLRRGTGRTLRTGEAQHRHQHRREAEAPRRPGDFSHL